MSQFFSGALDPTWPHAILIAGTIIGGALVGLGVILEAPKILSGPVAAVFLGVVIEAACTLLLFGFDEGITGKQKTDIEAQQSTIRDQNSQIIMLEKRLAARSLSDDQMAVIGKRLAKFAPQTFQIIPYWKNKESKGLADQIATALGRVGWTLKNPERYTALIGVLTGVLVNDDRRASGTVREAAKELVAALKDNGIDAEGDEHESPKREDRYASGD